MAEHSERKSRSRRSSVAPKSSRTRPAAPAAEDSTRGVTFPVVGIGASAGGVEALSLFFDAMPSDSGSAFVVVLHLDPTRESQMAHILSSHTAMPVVEIEDGMPIAPDHVYVIAPDAYLEVRDGVLHLCEPTDPRGHRHPVDVLFKSLAEDQHERAVVIVLSGTGANGSVGLKDVKAEGGLILVQDPHTAKFDGMPRSAIATDMADHILAPEKMPEALLRYLRHDYIAAPSAIEATPDGQAMLDRVLEVLRARVGHDFRSYKRSTLQRRIHRRLGLRNIGTLTEYIDELRASPDEATTLTKDLLISITGFFRDPEAWKALADQAIAPLIAERETGASVRVWVPCCATGEEAYTVAMLVVEQAEAAGKHFDLKIFATDAQAGNLNKARDGAFPQAAAAGLPPERLRRFFEKPDGSYQVRKELRDLIVFAPQNLLRDPPFSRLDLISCRNLLIYLEPEAQERVIALCHFALREGGVLFLGNAETIGRHDDLFDTVSKKWRIYRRLGPTRHDIVDFPLLRGPVQPHKTAEAAEPSHRAPMVTVPPADVARRALLDRYAPASVLVDRKYRVLYFHGPTGDYLEQPTGEPTRNLLEMARDGLAAKLRLAVREAFAENRSATASARIRQGKSSRQVAVTVTPLPASGADGASALVVFEPESAFSPEASSDIRQEPVDGASGERALQEELKAARLELRDSVEQMETANEELKASNEEVTSMNEELQSTNEELETSKEELQSFNEELHTVNNQLQHKTRELENANDDLTNLLSGTETATLFLDTDFSITWFSPATKALFDLVPSDIGRPVGHFARKFADESLLDDAATVLQKLTANEAEVRSSADRWYLRRTLPYRTRDNRIAGVVVTFTDITERKRAADAVNEARVYAEAIVETVRQPLLVLDGELRVVSANPAFYALFRASETETEGRPVYEMGNRQWDIPALREHLAKVLSRDGQFSDVEIEHEFRDIGRRCMLLNGRRLSREGGRAALILLAFEDITERRTSENAIGESEARYRTLFNSIDEGFCVIEKVDTAPGDPIDFRYLVANPAFERQTGVGGVVGKTIREAFPGEPQEWFDTYDGLLKNGEPIRFERGLVTKGRVLELYAFRLDDVTQRRVAVIFQDITGRKQAEEIGHRLAAIVESSDDAIISKDLDGIVATWNKGAEELFGYTAEEMIGKPVATLIPADRPDEEPGILKRIRRGESIDHYETVRRRKDGSSIGVSLTVSPLKDGEGRVFGASKIARDMTERQRADAQRELLIGELNHRVKNTLAIVQAIAAQTLGDNASVAKARDAFGSRLAALARAHDLLTRESWEGTDLDTVVRGTIEPHAGASDRFRVDGPPVRLAPSMAISMALALHELCTNATKYGALSSNDGQVEIVWRVTGDGKDRRLHLRWAESGGPPVVPPKRKGFGSRLVERALAQELGGEVRVSYEPSGVVCAIEAPLPFVQARSEQHDDRREGQSETHSHR